MIIWWCRKFYEEEEEEEEKEKEKEKKKNTVEAELTEEVEGVGGAKRGNLS